MDQKQSGLTKIVTARVPGLSTDQNRDLLSNACISCSVAEQLPCSRSPPLTTRHDKFGGPHPLIHAFLHTGISSFGVYLKDHPESSLGDLPPREGAPRQYKRRSIRLHTKMVTKAPILLSSPQACRQPRTVKQIYTRACHVTPGQELWLPWEAMRRDRTAFPLKYDGTWRARFPVHNAVIRGDRNSRFTWFSRQSSGDILPSVLSGIYAFAFEHTR